MKLSKKNLQLLVVPGAVSLFILLLALPPLSLLTGLDKSLFDFLLGLKASPPVSDRVVHLDVDDLAIDKVGRWPWPRSLMADGLVTLREMGLSNVVFDIEYVNPSPPGVNSPYLEQDLKREFSQTFSDLGSNISDLFTAIQSKQLTLKQAVGPTNELVAGVPKLGDDLYASTKKVAIDNDLYLGQAMAYFGAATITLNRQSAPPNPSDTEHKKLLDLAASRFSRSFSGQESRPPLYHDFYVPLKELTARAKSAGLTNVTIDPDGKRRRIRLFENVNGHWYAQLGFVAALELLGHPQVEISDNQVTLKDAKLADGTVKTLEIPLDSDGAMLIHWLKTDFLPSFSHVSFYQVIDLQNRENRLVQVLQDLGRRDSWKAWNRDNEAQGLLDAYDAWKALREKALVSGAEEAVKASVQAKESWLKAVDQFVGGSTPAALQKVVADQQNASKGDQKELWGTEAANLKQTLDNLTNELAKYKQARHDLSARVSGRLAFLGVVGTGTSDLGTTPFYTGYPLVGTHANVANTILSGKFLTETPSWWSLLLVPFLGFGVVFLLRNLPPLTQNLTGFGVVIAFLGLGVGLFLFYGFFVAMAAPLLVMFLSFVVYSLVRFFGTEQEKSFLRKAFSTYLSGDVIDEIVTDPGKLKLGGDQKWMTAMFTDVKGFSTISEKLTPTGLVHLLNEYLSGMSDLILNEKGTIDKYEGDAIIAFFGAPLDLPDHAGRACLAAIRMRQLEERLNPGFLERGLSPTPLMTRIGINTGEMVVGNMGTERKMNYTIMGNAVNLSARLEGVNKQYGTWILTTEFTAKEAGSDYLFRRLDQVRVVGINTPVRLMNLLGLKSEEGEAGAALVDGFHAALDLFEARQWPQAAAAFKAVADQFPDDGPAKIYAKRSQEFMAKAPAQDWDGVFNLTEK